MMITWLRFYKERIFSPGNDNLLNSNIFADAYQFKENKNKTTTTTGTSFCQERVLEITTEFLKQYTERTVKKKKKKAFKPNPNICAQTNS